MSTAATEGFTRFWVTVQFSEGYIRREWCEDVMIEAKHRMWVEAALAVAANAKGWKVERIESVSRQQ